MFDLNLIPSSPGVYIYRNSENKIIYIGKAINLKKRVSQYFQRDDALGQKTLQLVSQINKIDYKVVGSEIEALILEASLIKQYRPKYNSQLKDDKSYVYITITKDKYPLIKSAFKSTLNSDSIFYGPFPNSTAVKSLLKTIRHIFPYYSSHHSKNKCLYCHIGLCPGPDISISNYKKNISQIKNILSGNFRKLLSDLTKEMKIFSKNENYEMAKIKLDQINAINYFISGWRNLNNLYQQIDLPEDQTNKALAELKMILSPHLNNLKNINRLEAFDISNLGNKYFVGSMVVFQNGNIDKNEYRKFKIYSKDTPDDQLMIKEVVYRRLKHPEWGTPQIILVDGGKPQVSAANSVIKNIPIIGLAKREETIVIKNDKEWTEINLPKNSPSLLLLQRLRDEAHRFANKYRKELIKKNTFAN
ncbi:MAG: GIY-YIG nuclease family protein [Candidatus Shapirobacteria bacterium]